MVLVRVSQNVKLWHRDLQNRRQPIVALTVAQSVIAPQFINEASTVLP